MPCGTRYHGRVRMRPRADLGGRRGEGRLPAPRPEGRVDWRGDPMKTSRHIPVLLVLVLLLLGLVFAASAGAASKAQIDAAIASGVDYLVPLQSTGGAPTGAWPATSYYPRQHRLRGGGAGALRRAAPARRRSMRRTPTPPTFRPGSTTSSRRRSTTDATTGSTGTIGGIQHAYQTGPCLMAIARSAARPTPSWLGGALERVHLQAGRADGGRLARLGAGHHRRRHTAPGTTTRADYGRSVGDRLGRHGARLRRPQHGLHVAGGHCSLGCPPGTTSSSRLLPGPTFGGAAYTSELRGLDTTSTRRATCCSTRASAATPSPPSACRMP